MYKKNTFYLGLISLILALAAGCGGEVAAPMATAVPTLAAPAAVVSVREAVLDFLRDGASECVPPAGVAWQTSSGGAQTPAGYALYRFTTSDDCTVTVSYPLDNAADPLYHVALGHGVTGFCWQALVDGQGHIVQTGAAANTDPAVGNPAAVYCEAQGYTFEVETRANGMQCGFCAFPDGSRCNGWAYLHDECQPAEGGSP